MLIVQKYGGSSVADGEKIRNVARRVAETAATHRVVVVVSAMGKTTDGLLALARQQSEDPDPRELDMLLATGEQVTIALLAMALGSLGFPARSFTGAQAGMRTTAAHTRARITRIDADRGAQNRSTSPGLARLCLRPQLGLRSTLTLACGVSKHGARPEKSVICRWDVNFGTHRDRSLFPQLHRPVVGPCGRRQELVALCARFRGLLVHNRAISRTGMAQCMERRETSLSPGAGAALGPSPQMVAGQALAPPFT